MSTAIIVFQRELSLYSTKRGNLFIYLLYSTMYLYYHYEQTVSVLTQNREKLDFPPGG